MVEATESLIEDISTISSYAWNGLKPLDVYKYLM